MEDGNEGDRLSPPRLGWREGSRWREKVMVYYYGVKVALGNRGMTVEAARQCAKDRKEWGALVHM